MCRLYTICLRVLMHKQTARPEAPYYMLCKIAAQSTATLTCGLQCCGRHLNGFADRPPVRPNMSLGDTLAGLHAAFGVVMALLHRQRHQNKVPGQVSLLPHQVVHDCLLVRHLTDKMKQFVSQKGISDY